MRVLLLSAYAARSHVYWQDALQSMFANWTWQVLSLPPRHFSWRMRGNPLYWAMTERKVLEQDWDLVVATSMVDLATLRGLVPALATVPTVLYFHENQFEYPQHRQQHSLLEAQMVSLYSALAADHILFNSAYNRQSFFTGCEALMSRLPDRVPPGVVDFLTAKSGVLAVPLALDELKQSEAQWPGRSCTSRQRPLRLLWVGRFEHDKGGDGLLRVLTALEEQELDYELAVIGQQFRSSPPVFSDIEKTFSHRLVQFGYMPELSSYRGILRGADLVLSTAVHEFQGLAVLEAVASGTLPVVPARLAYPEIYARQFCYASYPGEPGREANAAARKVLELAQQLREDSAQVPDVSNYGREYLEASYRELFTAVAGVAG